MPEVQWMPINWDAFSSFVHFLYIEKNRKRNSKQILIDIQRSNRNRVKPNLNLFPLQSQLHNRIQYRMSTINLFLFISSLLASWPFHHIHKIKTPLSCTHTIQTRISMEKLCHRNCPHKQINHQTNGQQAHITLSHLNLIHHHFRRHIRRRIRRLTGSKKRNRIKASGEVN